MSEDTINSLRKLFETIRDERRMHANTAERIGNAFLALLDYIKNAVSDLYLSRVKDDTAQGRITFLKGLEAVGGMLVRGVLTAWEAVMNRVRSENYTDDTGWELTNDNGAGASQLTVDYIRARRKLIAESVEVKEYHASAGDEIITGATAEISRVDYFDSEGNQLGVHPKKVPFTLGGVLLMLQKVMGTAGMEPRGIAADSRAVRGALSAAERQRIARVRCYFLASDGERDVENWWAVGDLAYCKTQNLTRTPRDSRMGSSEKAGNVFWWRQVTGIDADGAVTLEDGKEYHYIDFSVNYAEEQAGTYNNSAYLSDLPAPGDKCMQFGNVGNSDRMNAIMVEVNGVGNVNAPDIVFYRGIYTYSLDRCWWGGESCRKAKLSPSTGWEFTGPDFKFLTEYGQARVPVDRGAWSLIPEERDVREPHENVRKCYYFDRVTHLGSLWLCVKADDYIWLKNEGTTESPIWNYWGTTDPRTQPDYSDDLYRRVLDYTTVEPSENAPTVWQKQVSKGETPVPVSAYQWNQSPTVAPSPLPATGATLPSEGWTATAPARPGNGYYLWMTMCSRYGDGSYTPWGDAVCITGGQGSAGEDAKEREWIYIGKSEPTTFSGDTLPANIKKDVDGTTRTDDYIATTDDFVPQGWQDTAIAIDETANRYVYASWRVWDKQTQRWGSFQPPILWGNWGVKGEDGDGVQYVFRLFDHELSDTERDTTYKPTRQGLEPTQEGEWIPAGWSDDPLSTTSQLKWCYCSTIKRIGGEWGDFEKLALWSKWSEDGTSPWVADLDNEMDSVACDADGHPVSEQTVTTGVSLVYGGERRNATVAVYKDRACEQPYTNSETLENGLAVYWTIGARSSHTVSVTVGSALTISGSMNFYVKITDGESGVFRLLVFTVNGMRPGADGQPATIYNLLPSEKQVSVGRDADGMFDPATFSLTCGYVKNVGGVMTTVDNVQAKIDDKYELYFRLRGRESQQMGNYVLYRNTHGGQVPVWNVGDYDEVEFVLSTAASTLTVNDSNIIDRETIPVVADGKQGEQGDRGTDGYALYIAPQSLILESTLVNGNETIGYGKTVTITVLTGAEPAALNTFALVNTSGTYSNITVNSTTISVDYSADTKAVTVTLNGGIASGASFGYFSVRIGTTDGKFMRTVRINFYVNRTQTFIRKIVAGVERALGLQTVVSYDDLGSVIKTAYEAAIETSAQGFEQRFRKTIGINLLKGLLDGSGWMSTDDDHIFIPSYCQFKGKLSGDRPDLYSPWMYLEAGYYVLSFYTPRSISELRYNVQLVYSNDPSQYRPYASSITFRVINVLTSDTVIVDNSTYTRVYINTQLTTSQYYCANIYDSATPIAFPQLEKAESISSVPTAFGLGYAFSESVIKQTAEQIRLAVLGAGIDITNRLIKAQADNFEIWNSRGTVRTFYVNAAGDIVAAGGAMFNGTISAKSLLTSFFDLTGLTSPIYVGDDTPSDVWNYRVAGQVVVLPADRSDLISQRILLYNPYLGTGGTHYETSIVCYDSSNSTYKAIRGVGLPSSASVQPINYNVPVYQIDFCNGVVELMCVPNEDEDMCDWSVVNIGTNVFQLRETHTVIL